MECFHFFEQRFPCICLNKVPIAFVQHFIFSIPNYRYINFFELQTRGCETKFYFDLLTRRLKFYFSTPELLTQN